LVAAYAAVEGAAVLHHDRDFELIEECAGVLSGGCFRVERPCREMTATRTISVFGGRSHQDPDRSDRGTTSTSRS
jgi:hypothetical protein